MINKLTDEDIEKYISIDGDISYHLKELPFNQRYMLKLVMITNEYLLTTDDVFNFLKNNRPKMYNIIIRNPKGINWIDDNVKRINKLILYST